MGHFLNEVVGVGKNKREALRNAIDDFLYQEGHRHDFRRCKRATLLGRVPPQKMKVEKKGNYEFHSMQPDPTAPQNEWLEEWEFEIETHA